jgi:branched-chain amino acid transport system permease protein
MATVIGITFAFAALRVKGLYLALSTLALQFVMDWVISHVPAISGGVAGHAAGAGDAAAGPAHHAPRYRAVLRGAGLVPAGDAVHAEPAPHRAGPRAGGRAREGLRRRGDRRAQPVLQAGGLRDLVVHRRRQRRAADLHLLPAVTPEQFAVNVSIELLAMVIVGGLASIIGSWFGAAFILLMPGQINS